MGKRLKRIFRAQLKQEQSSFLGRQVNVVQTDARTMHGLAKSLEADALLVQDMRSKTHRLPLQSIVEVVLDFEADY